MQEGNTTLSRFGWRSVLLVAGSIVWVGVAIPLIQARVRPLAPILLFIILTGIAQGVFGRIPRLAATWVGAALVVGAALINPVFEGHKRLQSVGLVDVLLLASCGWVMGYLVAPLMTGILEGANRMRGSRSPRVYAVPRRFSTGAILLATTCFAVLFGVLNYAQARPWELFFYASFVATVSLFQAVFQRSPRWASIVAGGFFLPVSMLLFATQGRRSLLPRIRLDRGWSFDDFLLAAMLVGILVGYLGGTLIAGVFLISDFIVRLIAPGSVPPRPAIDRLETEAIPSGTLSRLAERAVAARRDRTNVTAPR